MLSVRLQSAFFSLPPFFPAPSVLRGAAASFAGASAGFSPLPAFSPLAAWALLSFASASAPASALGAYWRAKAQCHVCLLPTSSCRQAAPPPV